MFAIITPVLAIPIIAALATGSRARKTPVERDLEHVKTEEIVIVERLPWKERAVSMFWQLDLIGLLLFIGGTGMFLITITLANNKTKSWADGEFRGRGHTIRPLSHANPSPLPQPNPSPSS